MTPGDGPAAGWYPDPHDPAQQRYWDGEAWTEHRHPGQGESATGPEDTAVLPRTDEPPSRRLAEPADTGRSPRGGGGWVPALVGLLVGLIVGGTAAAVVVGNNDDSSSPRNESSASGPASTTTATATSTATATTTATVTATATATVTATPSP